DERLLSLELQGVTPVAPAALEQHVRRPETACEGHRCHHHKQDVDVDRHDKHLVIRLSKCVTMAGPTVPPRVGSMTCGASKRARVTQILGFCLSRRPPPRKPGMPPGQRRG